MRRSRSPASSCCTAFGRNSSNCDLSAFKVELHLQSGTRCFRPELCAAKQECLLVLAICTRARPPTAAADNRWRYAAEAGDFRRKPRLHRTRNREFESTSLQGRVCLSSEPLGCLRKARQFGGGLRVTGDARRDVQGTNRRSLAVFLGP